MSAMKLSAVVAACLVIGLLSACRSGETIGPVEAREGDVWIHDLTSPVPEGARVLVSGESLRHAIRGAMEVPAIDEKGNAWIEVIPAPEYGPDVFGVRGFCPPHCKSIVGPGLDDNPFHVHCDCRPDVPGEDEGEVEVGPRPRTNPCELRFNPPRLGVPAARQRPILECVAVGPCSSRCRIRFVRVPGGGFVIQCVCR